jgi:hypothetical protein
MIPQRDSGDISFLLKWNKTIILLSSISFLAKISSEGSSQQII